MTSKPIYYTQQTKVLAATPTDNVPAGVVSGPYRKDDGVWYEKRDDQTEHPIFQQEHYISICEFLREEDVEARDGVVFFTVPQGLDGKQITMANIESFGPDAGGSCSVEIIVGGSIGAGEIRKSSLLTHSHSDSGNKDLEAENLTIGARNLVWLRISNVTPGLLGLSATLTVK